MTDKFFVITFALCISFFSLLSWLSFAEVSVFGEINYLDFTSAKNKENRNKEPWPTKLDFSYPRKFDTFYQDHFPFRIQLIQYFFTLNKFLGNNPRVIFGKDDWLYLRSYSDFKKTDNAFGDFIGTTVLSNDEISKVKKNFECQRDFFKKRNILWFVVMPPNKMTIYPEYLPKNVLKRQASFVLADQISGVFKEIGVPFLSLKNALLNAKKQGEVFFKTDTHWNNLGGYFGFIAIAKELGFSFPHLKSLTKTPYVCGDVFRMTGLNDKNCTDIQITPVLSKKLKKKSCESSIFGRKKVCQNQNAPYTKEVLIIRDSFTLAMEEYLAQSFKKATLLWRSRHTEQELKDELEKTTALEVIYITTERFILENQNAALCPASFLDIKREKQRFGEENNV